MNLLPLPKSIQRSPGRFVLQDGTRIYLPTGIEQPELLAALRLRDAWWDVATRAAHLDRLAVGEAQPAAGVFLGVRNAAEIDPVKRDSYSLIITPERIELLGGGNAGLFNGLQTLRQLADQFGAELPCLQIDDTPDFGFRGFYFDVSRGKVPTLETLQWLIDLLADHKINQFQLYVEHPYNFRFAPGIAQGLDALTAEELILLGAYCKDRRIDFVPSLQSFGHMAGVLSLPEYRHLAEIEVGPWEELSWNDRMKGATIDMMNPEALELLTKMHAEFLPLFDSPYVNVCADETYALGNGKNKELAGKEGKGTLYLRHINWLNNLVKSHGRRMMFWGDVVKQHPESIPEIPKDAILLNWGYHRTTDFESTAKFAEAGLEFYVCPGTSGWNRILNDVANADLNIRRYAATGKKYGATGLLNTDWGDHGHYNLLAGSLHGIVLGAAMAWNVDGPDEMEFDRAWNDMTFGVNDGKGVAALREQSIATQDIPTWKALYCGFRDEEHMKNMTEEMALNLMGAAADAQMTFEGYLTTGAGAPWIAEELHHMARANALLAEKFLLVKELKDGPKPGLAKRLRRFADNADKLYADYEPLWMARNKRTDLARVEEKFRLIATEARAEAESLAE